MPEAKNTFLKAKMNKSLDDRLLPQGEYRDALNVQITKNDGNGSDVGVVHSVKGNQIAFTSLGLSSSYDVIGGFFDDKNNRIYWFVTDGSNDHRIYVWSPDSNSHPTVDLTTPRNIVSGSFLNFSKSKKIYAVNLLEDLLFWTDNKNQPRRINVNTAISNNNYYSVEHKISVAKYAPWEAPLVQAGYDSTIQSDLLEEEFVRFAYRYKYSNNEYSIISPFSQIVFEMGDGATASNEMSTDDESKALKLTENHLVVNRANKVDISIPLPSTSPTTDYEIIAIEILYKESDSVAVRIIETIDVTDSLSQSNGYHVYTYKSKQPKYTLSEDQVTRAYDNVPIRALSQEVAGNRVVYGNFTQNYDVPDINYSVYYSVKNDSNHPHQSIKQRRSYEVGIVLVDKYGRTSPVILSDTSQITVEAKAEDFNHSGWNGDSLKIAFNADIEGHHVYGDSSIDANLGNDLGWYTYRVVVKQLEQEYYNVYNPGVSHGYINIHNDNINKVPRNTDNSIDNDGLYPTNSRLYPKVINYDDGTVGFSAGIEQKLSNEGLYDIESIGTAKDHGIYDDVTVDQVQGFYEQRKFHLLGKLEEGIDGNTLNYNFPGVLSVFETEPFESSLDIFYETSTSGVIQTLNDAADTTASNILLEPCNSGNNVEGDVEFSESVVSGNYVARLRAVDSDNNDIPFATFALNSVTVNSVTYDDTTSPLVSGIFVIEQDATDGYYKIKTAKNFYFDSSTAANNEYDLNLTATVSGTDYTETTGNTITVTNAAPTLTGINNKTIPKDAAGDSTVYTLAATNGSADTSNNTSGLTVSHVEYHDDVAHTTNIFASSISNGVVTIAVVSGGISAAHHGEYITVEVTVTNGTLTATKSTVIYISNLSGGTGLTSYSVKLQPNTTEYSTTAQACSGYNTFPNTVTIYSDADPSTGSQIYKDSSGSALATAGWYSNGSWSGLWQLFQTSNGYVGQWTTGPSSCTT